MSLPIPLGYLRPAPGDITRNMNEATEDLEAKLLAILNEPEETEKVVNAIEKSVDDDALLSEDERAVLGSLLEAGMPTPEEIIRDAQIAEHNAKIAAKRKADLAARKLRRQKRGKLKKKHRRG